MSTNSQKSDTELQELFENACNYHQEERFEEAEKIYHYLAEIVPDSLVVNYNYGLLLFEINLFDKALDYYEKAVELAPDNPDVLYNYALCLKNCDNYEGTIAAYKKILSEYPEDTDSLYNLACCYKDMGSTTEAIDTYDQVLKLHPDHTSALNNQAYLQHKVGNLEQATSLYERLVRLHPEHTSAVHMLASLQGQSTKSAPKEYVTEVFDTYSTHYEKSLLTDLAYDVPNIMRRHFNAVISEPVTFQHGIDLGCGTGLAALAFGELCRHLTGIDLSEKMLREAEKKELYQKLVAIDIEEFLRRKEKDYNIILAADVFTYLGELKPVFQALYRTAAESAFFCFSTEKTEKGSFQLRQTGRFAHSSSYVIELGSQTGWKLLNFFPEKLRKEKDRWIEGYIFFMQKT